MSGVTPIKVVPISQNLETPSKNEPSLSNVKMEPEPITLDIPVEKESKVAVVNPEVKVQTSEYSSHDYTQAEIDAANDLKKTLAAFLTKTVDASADDSVKCTIPTGIDVLDTILGGGVATKLFQVVGMPGSGKSALVARIIATAQRKWPGKSIGIYVDSEQSMSSERLEQLGVCNPTITPYGDDISVEKVFKFIEGICVFKEQHPEYMDIPACVIWDSIANTLTEKGVEAENQYSVLGQKAALLSHLLPKYVNKLNKYAICMVGVNQLREKIEMGMMHTPPTLRFLADKNIPGGNSLLFNSFQLLFLRQKEALKEYGFEGVIVTARTIKNKLFTPNVEVEMVFSFEHGFSNFWTNYELLKKFKRVTCGGGWVSLENYDGKKCQQKGVIQKYKEDPEFRVAWDCAVQDVLKTEYIEKYRSGNKGQTEVW